jgi:hypothetical protein
MKAMSRDKFLILAALATAGLAALAGAAGAQTEAMAEHAMSGHSGINAAKHMEMTPVRSASRADSARARALVAELRTAIAKYGDTSAAVADGYRMFLPNVKQQHVYHFTNYGRGFKEAFRFNPSQPTSLLYSKGADGKLALMGAMYTMPKNTNPSRLNDRVPLGIARWHKHVNWCLPRKGEQARFGEKLPNGQAKFGPESPIATMAECAAVGGAFHATLFGWMLHANVFAGDDLAAVFRDG